MNCVVEVLVSKFICGRVVFVVLLVELGEYFDGGLVQVLNGCYGFYVRWGKVNVILLCDLELGVVMLECVFELIIEKVGKVKKFVVKKFVVKVVEKKFVVKKVLVKKVFVKKFVKFLV